MLQYYFIYRQRLKNTRENEIDWDTSLTMPTTVVVSECGATLPTSEARSGRYTNDISCFVFVCSLVVLRHANKEDFLAFPNDGNTSNGTLWSNVLTNLS